MDRSGSTIGRSLPRGLIVYTTETPRLIGPQVHSTHRSGAWSTRLAANGLTRLRTKLNWCCEHKWTGRYRSFAALWRRRMACAGRR